MFRKIYKNKKVLITGNTGFKGTWLSLFLQKLGASLQGIALKPPEISAFNLCKLDSSYSTLYEDICNVDALNKLQNDFQPEIVFHMAAQPLITASYQDPIETYRVNVLGTSTENVLVGHQAGLAMGAGSYNTAVGALALKTEDSGSRSVAIGTSALFSQNVAFVLLF